MRSEKIMPPGNEISVDQTPNNYQDGELTDLGASRAQAIIAPVKTSLKLSLAEEQRAHS